MTTVIAFFCCFENEYKKSCVLCRNLISIYKINRTLHGRLGIRILSSRAESISHSFASLTRERYFQHSNIKFVSPRGHVISSITYTNTDTSMYGQRTLFCVASQPRFTDGVHLRTVYDWISHHWKPTTKGKWPWQRFCLTLSLPGWVAD